MDTESAKQQRARKVSLTVGLFVDHAKAVRIPLLIILFGVVVTFWVDQAWELFLLLILPASGKALSVAVAARAGAIVMSGCLGFAVWHTARTVYRFNIPTIPTLSDPHAEKLREWLPRGLGALIPLLMAAGTASALQDPSLKGTREWWPSMAPYVFVLEAVALFVFFVIRRPLLRAAARATMLAKTPAGDPRVDKWSQLPRSVRLVYAVIILANVLALVVVAQFPGTLAKIGPLGVLLLCATFLTVTGTYLTIQAARLQIPLLTALFALTMVMQLTGWNDNHRVRLYPTMHSDSTPQPRLVDAAAPIASSFVDYAKSWSSGRAGTDPIYLVSAEGGGIRAAVWTLLVLSRLEVRSNGEFSRHMLLGSGVSGGSLGLAWFAAIVKGERLGGIRLTDIDAMVRDLSTTDYLGPTLETMFLTDFLQRFLAPAMFIDRGERLESRFELGWTEACMLRQSGSAQSSGPHHPPPPLESSAEQQVCGQFAASWKSLWANADHVPLLFLNSTEVQSGHRFIEQPFATIRGQGQDFDITSAGTWSTGVLPASTPLSGVVHNSARFTYMSPAGSLIDAAWLKANRTLTRQLVDGGYFENSGTTTIAELLSALRPVYAPACSGEHGFGDEACPIKLIHISNDPGVESMRSDDACPDAQRYASPFSHYGEIRAPLLSLLNTREARGEAARMAVRRQFARGRLPTSATDTVTDNSVFHFRLCNGPYHLPLGWTLSADSLGELSRQLEGTPETDKAGFNHRQLDTIVARVKGPALTGPTPVR
jgi:hypothetical protein